MRALRSFLVGALVALGLVPASASASVDLKFWDGVVMPSARVVLVDWGSDVPSTFTSSSGDPAFFQYLASQNGFAGGFGGVIAQYTDTTTGAAFATTYAGQYTIAPKVGNGSSVATVTDAQIQSQLAASIVAGALPSVGSAGNTLYVVLFPPNDTINDDGGLSGGGWCAYHNALENSSVRGYLNYAVIPDNGNMWAPTGDCGLDNPTALANETYAVSHEFAEAATDPGVDPFGWYDEVNGEEVADICAGTVAVQGGWTVTGLWSNLDTACEASEPRYTPPTAVISAPNALQVATAGAFSGSGSSDGAGDNALGGAPGITGYSWNWGDGSATSTGATPAHTYGAPGVYTVTLTVGDKMGFTASTTARIDVFAPNQPTVTDVPALFLTSDSALMQGLLDPNGLASSYYFLWGESPSSLTIQTPLTSAGSGTTIESVSAALNSLQFEKTYYYELVVVANGRAYYGGVESFATVPIGGGTIPATPVVRTGLASLRTRSRALLNGTVNPRGLRLKYHFAWGTNPRRLRRSTPVSSALPHRRRKARQTAHPVSAAVRHLRAGTAYYFRLIVTAPRRTFRGPIHKFRTVTPLPGAGIRSASALSFASAALHGTVNPRGFAVHYFFEYGTSTKYGHSTHVESGGSGKRGRAVTGEASGLAPRTRYDFRLVVSGYGGTVYSRRGSFTTPPPPPPPPAFSFLIPAGQTRASALSQGIKVTVQCASACDVHFEASQEESRSDARMAIRDAIGSVHLASAGSTSATLTLTQAGRAAAQSSSKLNLTVTALATSEPGASSAAPASQTVALN